MTEETKTETVEEENAATAEENAPAIEPIEIDPEVLTEDGKAKAEKEQRRTIEDVAYTLQEEKACPQVVTAYTFALDYAIFDTECTRMLKDFGKQVTLPGYRKGKAPLNLLRRRLGEDFNREVIGSLGANVLRQYKNEKELEIIGKPQIVDFEVPEDKSSQVTLTVEVEGEPKVELKKYKGLKVEANKIEPTEKMMDDRLQQLRQQNAVTESAPEGTVISEETLLISIDADVRDAAGAPVANLCKENQAVYNWQHNLPVDVVEALKGKKVGDTIEVKVTTSKTNRRGEQIDHTDDWKVTVRDIKIQKLPELDDEFAKDMGEYETLDAFKAELQKEIDAQAEQQQKQESLSKIYEALIDENEVEAPRSMVGAEQMHLVMRDSQELARIGLRLENVIQNPEQYLADQEQTAAKTVALRLLLVEISKAESLDVTDEDLDKEIERMAEEAGRKPLAIRARLEAEKQLDQVRGQLAQKKVEDFLSENNTVKLVDPPKEEAKAEGEEA